MELERGILRERAYIDRLNDPEEDRRLASIYIQKFRLVFCPQFNLSTATAIGIICSTGADSWTPPPADTFSLVNVEPTQRSLPWNIATPENLGGEARKVVYVPCQGQDSTNETTSRGVCFRLNGVPMFVPMKDLFFNPMHISFLFGDDPQRHWLVKNDSESTPISNVNFEAWKRDVSELDLAKAKRNLLLALNDDEEKTEQMIAMLREIYLPARFEHADWAQRELLHELLLLIQEFRFVWIDE